MDQVGDGLDLRQVQLAVEEGATRELAGLCGVQPMGVEGAQNAVNDVCAAVTSDLNDMFAGVGMRSDEHCAGDRVDAFVAVVPPSVLHGVIGSIYKGLCATEECIARGTRLRTRHADHGEACHTRWSCECTNGR